MRKSLPILALVLILLATSTVALADTAAAPAGGVVNINTADVGQLTMLPRVGEKAAQRIVDYRTQHGPFKKASDLMQVKGFGAKSFEKLSAYLAVDGRTTLSSKVKSPRSPRAKKPANTASKS